MALGGSHTFPHVPHRPREMLVESDPKESSHRIGILLHFDLYPHIPPEYIYPLVIENMANLSSPIYFPII